MLRKMTRFLVVCSVFSALMSAPAHADTELREFMMSCHLRSFGRHFVGAASLAFTDKPGENLNRVARGASIGLYAGILLGLYVVYVVPSQMQRDQDEYAPQVQFRFNVYPLIGERKVEGPWPPTTCFGFKYPRQIEIEVKV